MSATFLTLGSRDLFKQNSGNGQSLISIPEVDKIVGQSGLALYNHVGLQIGETIQYFLTFDDVIKFIHFGKGVGAVTVEGTLYSDCSGNIPGISKFKSAITELRGEAIKIGMGGIIVTAVMTTAQINVTGDPDTMALFSFAFSIVNHDL